MAAFDKISLATITISLKDGAIPVISMSGRGTDMDPSSTFDEPFEQMHQDFLNQQVKEVILDCNDLEYLNSSHIKVLIRWMTSLLRLKDEQRYVIRIKTSPNQPWQQKTFSAFPRLLPNNVEIV